MDYQVVVGLSIDVTGANENLRSRVKELLPDGWKPQGGISYIWASQKEKTWLYACQAMIKED